MSRAGRSSFDVAVTKNRIYQKLIFALVALVSMYK
jgi:hypothetical protein